MNQKALVSLARELRQQREELLKELTDVEAGLQFIAEDRESEREERAQEERWAALLGRLDERSREAVAEIDQALRRISDGTYGRCESCGNAIAIGRLRTLPATRACFKCARGKERPET